MQWIKYLCVLSPKDERVVYIDAWLLTNEKGEPVAVLRSQNGSKKEINYV
jgi:hypothetical protein